MNVIVGLGNPGKEYERSRHNVGFMVLDRLRGRLHAPPFLLNRIGDCLVSRVDVNGHLMILAKPQLFMNRSGIPIRGLLEREGLTPDDISVVYDDLDLPFARLRIRADGGSGGHRGMESLIEELEAKNFSRLRVGIGRPEAEEDIVKYVLSPFNPGEEELLPDFITWASRGAESIVTEGLITAMNTFNKPFSPDLVSGKE